MKDDIEKDYVQQIKSSIKAGNDAMLAEDYISAISHYKSALRAITESQNDFGTDKKHLSVIKDLELDATIQIGLCYCGYKSADPDGIYLANYIEKAQNIDSNNAKLFFLCSMAMNQMGKTDLSIQAMENAHEKDSNNPLYLYNLSVLCKNNGKNWHEYLKLAEEISPNIKNIANGKLIYILNTESIASKSTSASSSEPIQSGEFEKIIIDDNTSELQSPITNQEPKKTKYDDISNDDWGDIGEDKKSHKGINKVIVLSIIVIITVVAGVFIAINGGLLSPISPPSTETNSIPAVTTAVSPIQSNSEPGSLSITSAPSSAEVYLNNEYKGKTPLGINSLSPGTYTVKLSKHDEINHYVDETMTVTINSGITTKKEVMLTLGGEIYVRTDPAGALLYLDAEYNGVSPMTIEGIKPGKHKLEAILEGYNKESYEFESGMGTSNSISLFFIGKTYG